MTLRLRGSRGRRLLTPLGLAVVAALLVAGCGDDTDTTETAEPTETTDAVDPDGDAPAQEPATDDPTIGTDECPPEEGAEERTTRFDTGPAACIDPTATYSATVVTSRGEFVVELHAAAAPKAVNNFVFLARHRFYEGVTFHRIIPGFVVQGGDATGQPPGTGDAGYRFEDELPMDGPPFYEVGSLAMANSGPDTNGSQFFIVTGADGTQLPPLYTRFGQVVEGMDVVEQIEATGTPEGSPTERTEIESVTVTAGP